jgi:DeoR/GlpR family transcriptional regulator of sugar metabolism
VSTRRTPASDRQDAIAERLRASGAITIGEIEALFGVSPVTVRRDLAELDRRGVVRRTYGGAVLPAAGELEPGASRDEAAHHALAAAALDTLAPGESAFLDSSEPSLALARAILEAALPMTLLTNSVRVLALAFAHATPGLNVIGLGGTLQWGSASFTGPATVRAIGEHFADRLFLGASGLTPAGVLTEADPLEAETKRAMLAHAGRATLLLEPATLAGHGLIAVAELAQLAAVIAAGVDAGDLALTRAPGVALTMASSSTA